MSDKHTIVVDVPNDRPQASGDWCATDIIIAELLENAIKYSPDGGTVNLSARPGEDWIEVAIDEEGIGIAESDLVPHQATFVPS